MRERNRELDSYGYTKSLLEHRIKCFSGVFHGIRTSKMIPDSRALGTDIHSSFVSSMWQQPRPQGQQREEYEVQAKSSTLLLSELGPARRLKDIGLDFPSLEV